MKKWAAAGAMIPVLLIASTGVSSELRDIAERHGAEDSIPTLEQVIPGTPGEVRTIIEYEDRIREATNRPLNAPVPRVRTTHVDLSPGAMPPVLQVRPGYDTAVTFTDSHGVPWPVADYGTGARDDYDRELAGVSTMVVRPVGAYRMSNLRVHLEGVARPVIFTLLHDDTEVDVNVAAIVPGRSPSAEGPLPSYRPPRLAGPALSDRAIQNFMDGVLVQGAEELKTNAGGLVRAFWYQDRLIVRTPLQLLLPQPVSRPTSVDGMRVHISEQLIPELLLVDHVSGSRQSVSITIPDHLRLNLTAFGGAQ